MFEINRSLIILKPKQPFLDWARMLDEEDKKLTLKDLTEDSTAYLVPEVWDSSEQKTLLESFYNILFEEELEGWCLQEADWPKERDLEMFLDWFEVEFHSMVFDLGDEPISAEENDPGDEDDSPMGISH